MTWRSSIWVALLVSLVPLLSAKVHVSKPSRHKSKHHSVDAETTLSNQQISDRSQGFSIASFDEGFATAELGFAYLAESSPDMTSICLVALGCMGIVILLDVLAHLLESFIENEDDKEFFDQVIDGVAAIVLFIIAGLWGGLLSEYIATKEYSTGRFPDVAFPVLVNKLIIIPVVGVSMAIAGQLFPERDPSILASGPGLIAGVEGILGEKALLYITFPVVSVFKSTTVIPTMIMNRFVNGDHASMGEYGVAAFICLCVLGFSRANARSSNAPHPDMALGCAMMAVFLILSSFMGVSQKKIFNSHPKFSTLQMMMVSSIWAAAFSFLAVSTTTGIQPLITFMGDNPECITQLLANGIAGTIYLYLLFYIIQHQGPVMLCVVGSMQKITSVILSSVLYNHPMTLMAQFCAFGAILGALGITFLSMKRKRRELALKRTGHLRDMFRATARMRGFSHQGGSSVLAAAKAEKYGSVTENSADKAA